MGLASAGGFISAFYYSYIGETFYCVPQIDAVRCANQFKLTSLIGSPNQLDFFVKNVKSSADGFPPIKEIRSHGGILHEALVHPLRTLFRAQIYNMYGSTEAGGVCFELLKNNIIIRPGPVTYFPLQKCKS